MYLEFDQAFEDKLYEKLKECLFDSKAFLHGDHDMKVHLVFDNCKKCKRDKFCKKYDTFHEMRFDAFYDYLRFTSIDTNFWNNRTDAFYNYREDEYDNAMEELEGSNTFDKLFDKFNERLDNDVEFFRDLYEKVYEIDDPLFEFFTEYYRD